MRRPPQIRITKNDREEYARLVRNAKAKIRRTDKNYGIDLSNEINIPNLSNIKTREQYNEVREQLKSFTNAANTKYQFRKNEHGVVASKRELNEVERNTKRAQRLAQEKLKNLKKIPEVEQRMRQMAKPQNLTGVTVPKDFEFDKYKDRKSLEKKISSMEKRATIKHYSETDELMKKNFIDALEKNFHSDADEVVKMIEETSADDVFEIYLKLVGVDGIDINYLYVAAGDGEETNMVIEKIMTYFELHRAGELNMDMKGF